VTFSHLANSLNDWPQKRLRKLSDEAIVFRVRPNPEPTDSIRNFHAEGPIVQPDSY